MKMLNYKNILLAVLLFGTFLLTNAQLPTQPGDPGAGIPVPIDGGLLMAILAGGGLAAMLFKKKKKEDK